MFMFFCMHTHKRGASWANSSPPFGVSGSLAAVTLHKPNDESRDESYGNHTNGQNRFQARKKNETSQPFGDSRRTWNEAHAETKQEEQGRSCALHYGIYKPKPTTAAVFGSRYINLKIFHICRYVCLPFLIYVAHNYT